MKNVFDTLKERGLIAQTTHEEEIRDLLGKEKVTFYVGFDPTADSLHIGHFMQLIVMKHMQNAGPPPDYPARRRYDNGRRPDRQGGHAPDDYTGSYSA